MNWDAVVMGACIVFGLFVLACYFLNRFKIQIFWGIRKLKNNVVAFAVAILFSSLCCWAAYVGILPHLGFVTLFALCLWSFALLPAFARDYL